MADDAGNQPSAWAALRRRKLVQWAFAYAAGAWVLLQVLSLLAGVYAWPAMALRIATGAVFVGFPVALVLAWYHGERGQQRASGSEVLIVAVLLAAGGALLWGVERRAASNDGAPVASAAPAGNPATAGNPAPRPPPGARSIAVLPFVNMSGEAENEFFSDGLSEEILNSLARIDTMQVVGRTSSFSFKGRNEDLRSVGEKLGVANVLEGSVRRGGDRARITAQLVRASDGFHLWSETYDRTLSDILAVQLDIAEHVAGALEVVLDDRQRERMRAAGVKNVDAFVAFQKARRFYNEAHDPTRSGNLIATLRLAEVEFKKATALEPGFSAAYYLGTDLHSHTIASDTATRAEREAALRDELRDLDLAARSSHDPKERDLIAVDRQLLTNDWRGLKERFALALVDQACHPSNWVLVGMAFGFAEERVESMRQTIVCEPLFGFGYVHGASAAIFAGRPEEALEFVSAGNRVLGNLPPLTLNGVRALVMLGRLDEARAQLATLDPDDFAGATGAIVLGAAVGDDIRAIRERSRRTRKPAWNPEYWDAFEVLAEALLGERDAANRRAAAIDAEPSGPLRLAALVAACQCGAPFDLEATPNFEARLAESGLQWPPPDPMAALKRKVAGAR